MNKFNYKIIVIGIGNSLVGDDGLGPKVVQKLQQEEWSEKILTLNGGTYPLNYLKELSQAQYVIAVDTIKGGNSVGTIYNFDLADIRSNINYNTNAHNYTLPQVIDLAQEMTFLPQQVIYYGIEPSNLNLSNQLSNPVKKASIKLIEKIKNQIILLQK